ncbi:MAG TPA: hypothetical protein VFS43_24265 [Polyangiaceae bacterium]|nr:hypothetical protein [Polyangiaceae bacterium]
MSRLLARALSIAGHPLLVLPAAVMAPLAARGQGLRRALPFALGFAAAGALVMGYSWWQVRRRRWAHVDASNQQEGALSIASCSSCWPPARG